MSHHAKDLNYTPFWRKRSRALGATHLCSPHGKPPREQPSLASLTSELADSASLGYLRHRRFAARHRVKNPLLTAKINIHPRSGWYFIFGHSPKTTGGAQVRFSLACQPCNCYLLPVNGFHQGFLREEAGAVRRLKEPAGRMSLVQTKSLRVLLPPLRGPPPSRREAFGTEYSALIF